MSDAHSPYANEGYELIGVAFEVHNVQGGGLLEEIYQQSLEVELELRGIPFQSKRQLTVFYKERELEKNTFLTCSSLDESLSSSRLLLS